MANAKSFWRRQDVRDAMKKLWDEHYSAAQSAAQLSKTFEVSISRNAVIGIWYRSGLSRPSFIPKPRGPRKRRAPLWRPAPKFIAEPAAPPPEACDIPIGQRRTLMELTAGMCRFPYGHPGTEGFFFCGAARHNDHPYCLPHFRITHEAPRPRQPVSAGPGAAQKKVIAKLFGPSEPVSLVDPGEFMPTDRIEEVLYGGEIG